MRSGRYIFTGLLPCTALAGALAADLQGQSPAAQPPRFSTTVAVLRLDVVALDSRGRAVADLGPADFEVIVDGKPRRVVYAQFAGSSPVAAAPGHVASEGYAVNTATDGHVVAFVVDLDSIRSGSERPLLDAAAALVNNLPAQDAVAIVPIPGRALDLTRDHAQAVQALRELRGTSQLAPANHFFTVEEARAFQAGDWTVRTTVIERECAHDVAPQLCPRELDVETRQRLIDTRRQAGTLLRSISHVAEALGKIEAPRTIVLMSGGLWFDPENIARFREVEASLKRSGVALYTIHVDQSDADASVGRAGEMRSTGPVDLQSGLSNLASMAGGVFYAGVGSAQGAFDRLHAEITEPYVLGIESTAGDSPGTPLDVRVTVRRAGVSVRARRSVLARSSTPPEERLAALSSQPVNVAELPLAASVSTIRGEEPATVKVLVRTDLGGMTPDTPVTYSIGIWNAAHVRILSKNGTAADADAASVVSVAQLPPGKYVLRVAALDRSGRAGTLEVPFVAGVRITGGLQASDVIVGTVPETNTPLIHVGAGTLLAGSLELSTDDASRYDTTRVDFELRRSGHESVTASATARLETTAFERQRIARSQFSTDALEPGEYLLTAVVSVDGKPTGRISRSFVILPASARRTATAITPAARISPSTEPSGADLRPTTTGEAALDDVLYKMSRYVSAYGERASAVVATEKYTQTVEADSLPRTRPRQLVAEFALVKTTRPSGWIGYRDVIEVNGKQVQDRRDRLVSVLMDSADPIGDATRIANESARYNVGPVIRNFNVPTTALFFFDEAKHGRFAFKREGVKVIDGVDTWEIAFRETASPTIVMTRAGNDVPSQGTIWVVPADGTIVRTRLQLTGFADTSSSTTRDVTPRAPTSRQNPFPALTVNELESRADVEVTYRRDPRLGMWVPVSMAEEYQGAIARPGQSSILGTTRSVATYSDYRQFETSTRITK
jgi:VWFA-related protein